MFFSCLTVTFKTKDDVYIRIVYAVPISQNSATISHNECFKAVCRMRGYLLEI